jgi:RsiW-degrading membrane proteinase PrsW (M82 family)
MSATQYYVVRNTQRFGPYDVAALLHYVNAGNILLQDRAQNANGGPETTVRRALSSHGAKPKIVSHGHLFKQIKAFGWDLLLPRSAFSYKTFIKDKRLLLLSLIGLAPAFLIKFTPSVFVTFYAIALYFSLIWALFFYYVFKTSQVKVRTTVATFFVTQALIFLLVFVFRFTDINPLYKLLPSNSFVLRLIGYVLGVGVFEETIKAIAVYYICSRSEEPQVPQTAVFYGLISGIGFGVFEGVMYQMGVNSQLTYSDSFFMNIARLTSLPFLHAIWAGIAGYFISLGFLFPKSRRSLWLLSIAIPAALHGLYDTLGWSIPGLIICYVGVGLLIVYLQRAKDFQSKLLP